MRTLVHLSDLHFGRIDESLIAPLVSRVHAIAPDLVVVSGDLTQRARSEQFKAARHFLDSLPSPQIVVPGNHDIPLHNVFNRVFRPLAKYRRYVGHELQPTFIDDEMVVLGINTARSLTIKDGRINRAQIDQLRQQMASLPETLLRIVVTHHPFDLPSSYDADDLVGRAPLAMETLTACKADLLLAGHLHTTFAGTTAARYGDDYAALVVQAGTATSTRGRGESNSFNMIQVSESYIAVERFRWQAEHGDFLSDGSECFERTSAGWHRRS